jgi:hypothetical protein
MKPPARFSTTTGWPSALCSGSDSARTNTSLMPPGLVVTITRIGRVG